MTYLFAFSHLILNVPLRLSAKKFFDLHKTEFFNDFLMIFKILHLCGLPVLLLWRLLAQDVMSCDIIRTFETLVDVFLLLWIAKIHRESTSQDEYEHFEVEGIDCEMEEESNSLEPYADKPLADKEWLEKYNLTESKFGGRIKETFGE